MEHIFAVNLWILPRVSGIIMINYEISSQQFHEGKPTDSERASKLSILNLSRERKLINLNPFIDVF